MPPSVFAPPAAEPVLRGSDGAIYAVSSFGVDATTFGPSFDPRSHFDSDRYRALDFKHQCVRGTRHDGKLYDFQGRMIRSGPYVLTQPFIGSSMPSTYVPLDQRRPSMPTRLNRLVVRKLTAFVFGEGLFPRAVSPDTKTEDFARALLKEASAQTRLLQARNLGGAVGTVGLSWRFVQGKPRIRVHVGQHLVPHSWADLESHKVEHVSEITFTERVEYDPKERKQVARHYWRRRDWCPNADVKFLDVLDEGPDTPIEWVVDERETFIHDDGFAHFVWVRNGSDDDDESNVDGDADCEGQYEQLDGLDILNSVVHRGGVRNLDPTLVLKMDAEHEAAAARGVTKGSDQSLSVGIGGDADYLELSGTATEAGLKLYEQGRSAVLETAQVVVPSTAELTAAGTSSVAQKMLFQPMLQLVNVHRANYGDALVELVEQMIASARRRYPSVDPETGERVYPVEVDADGQETSTEFFLDLPPKVVEEDAVDEHGVPTGEKRQVLQELEPGVGRVSLEWPPYFEATAQDVQAKAAAIASAAGGKPVLSQQTGTELIAAELRVDPAKEWQQVLDEQRRAAHQEAGMFGGAGGQVQEGAEPPPVAVGGVEGYAGKGASQVAVAKLKQAAAMADKIHTVNELRAQQGYGPLKKPDGTPDPNGDLPVPAFLALLDSAGTAAGTAGKGVPGIAPPAIPPAAPAGPGKGPERPGAGPSGGAPPPPAPPTA